MTSKSDVSFSNKENVPLNDNYDFSGLTMSASAIPDLDQMLEKIYELLEYTETPMMKSLEIQNKDMFERYIINKYHEVLPFKIIRLLMEHERYENLDKLLDMFEILGTVKSGKADVYDEFKKFNEVQNERYLYPKFGGKEKFMEKMSTVPADFKPDDTKNEPEIIIRDPNTDANTNTKQKKK